MSAMMARIPSTSPQEYPLSQTPRQILDQEPMGRFQIIAVTICICLYAIDGFDVLSISFAAPGIAEEWGINRAVLGIVLSMELIGMALGSIVIGPIADRWGRRPTILLCLVIVSLGMAAASTASSVPVLAAYRLGTGLGIGGMLAATSAMAAEYASARFRQLSVILMAGGYPVGVVIGGSIASQLLVSYDWRAVFLFGAAASALFIPIVWLALPESIDHLSQKRPENALTRINAILKRMGHQQVSELPNIEQPTASLTRLLAPSLRKTTLLLILAYFVHIMTFYFILKWIPKVVADMGFHPSEAGGVLVWANVGGVLGSVLIGLLTQRFKLWSLLLGALAGSAVCVVLFGQGQADLVRLSIVAAAAGFFTNAAIVAMYATFADVFPTELRAGGTGLVIGFGRGGAVLGPIVTGFLFQAEFGLSAVAALMSIGSLIAACAIFLLRSEIMRATERHHESP